MEFKQATLDFELHRIENSMESQDHLEENKVHFKAQCKKVFDLLMSGQHLTVLSAITNHGISSLPRRCLDITGEERRRTGIRISNKWIKPEKGAKYKAWYMTEADKEANRKLI